MDTICIALCNYCCKHCLFVIVILNHLSFTHLCCVVTQTAMVESPRQLAQQDHFVSPNLLAWTCYRPQKKKNHYAGIQDKYKEYISRNELLTIPSALEVMATRTISLLITDDKTQKLIGASRETMEETLKCLNIAAKLLAKCSNAMWNILLVSEVAGKELAGSIHIKKLRFQTVHWHLED